MKASVYYSKNDIRYEDVEVPEIGDGDMLIKMHSCGLCGTDIHKAQHQTVTGPVILGHEVSGEVVKVGKDVTRYRVGERVVTAIHVPCFNCHYCDRGFFTLCDQFKKTNLEPGGFSEFIRIPRLHVEHLTHRIIDSLDWDRAAMIEPVACCLHGLKSSNIHPKDTVLVLGSGTIGLVSAQLAALKGASTVIVSDLSRFKRELALKVGVTHAIDPANEDVETRVAEITQGKGPDVVIIAAGVSSLVSQAVNVVRRGGRIVVFSPFDKNPVVEIDAGRLFRDEISIVGTYSLTPYDMKEAIEIVEKDKINTKDMITHTWPLSRIAEAIEFASNPNNDVLKVIIKADA
ncbi:TPA: zinc-dependent dehydrogenase [Klebsiella quasipneumoniae]|uniref:zinc-dependent dehydrogenase n=1 Tax=Klebsiella quasipneumoniae TaxID=1463165 RepID=UPI0032FD6363|nr:zinc-dependent dehydrogenase [Klebsiella quasipneumoniae]HDN2740065.1 zinc-dependent dehydrogenase [Klebsiella quasipneumoniae]